MSPRTDFEDGIYEHREFCNRPLAHCIEIRYGVVIHAWVYQAEGEYESSGGWEASVIGKHADDLDLIGYRRQVRDKENAE